MVEKNIFTFLRDYGAFIIIIAMALLVVYYACLLPMSKSFESFEKILTFSITQQTNRTE